MIYIYGYISFKLFSKSPNNEIIIYIYLWAISYIISFKLSNNSPNHKIITSYITMFYLRNDNMTYTYEYIAFKLLLLSKSPNHKIIYIYKKNHIELFIT